MSSVCSLTYLVFSVLSEFMFDFSTYLFKLLVERFAKTPKNFLCQKFSSRRIKQIRPCGFFKFLGTLSVSFWHSLLVFFALSLSVSFWHSLWLSLFSSLSDCLFFDNLSCLSLFGSLFCLSLFGTLSLCLVFTQFYSEHWFSNFTIWGRGWGGGGRGVNVLSWHCA